MLSVVILLLMLLVPNSLRWNTIFAPQTVTRLDKAATSRNHNSKQRLLESVLACVTLGPSTFAKGLARPNLSAKAVMPIFGRSGLSSHRFLSHSTSLRLRLAATRARPLTTKSTRNLSPDSWFLPNTLQFSRIPRRQFYSWQPVTCQNGRGTRGFAACGTRDFAPGAVHPRN